MCTTNVWNVRTMGTDHWFPSLSSYADFCSTNATEKRAFSCCCTWTAGLHTMKEEITSTPAACLSLQVLCWCTCASVRAEQEPLPVHINQAAVFGRVIRGVLEGSFLWLFWFSHRFFADEAFISFVCVYVCYKKSMKEMLPEAQTDSRNQGFQTCTDCQTHNICYSEFSTTTTIKKKTSIR